MWFGLREAINGILIDVIPQWYNIFINMFFINNQITKKTTY